MYTISWLNRFYKTISLTHQYDSDVYKLGEALINEGKQITVCRMETINKKQILLKV